MPAVIRGAFIVLAICLVFELSGLGTSFGDTDCSADECPGDASGGECAPNCHLCACCSLPRVAPTEVATGEHVARATRTDFLRNTDMPASPEPADILHVPKPVLA